MPWYYLCLCTSHHLWLIRILKTWKVDWQTIFSQRPRESITWKLIIDKYTIFKQLSRKGKIYVHLSWELDIAHEVWTYLENKGPFKCTYNMKPLFSLITVTRENKIVTYMELEKNQVWLYLPVLSIKGCLVGACKWIGGGGRCVLGAGFLLAELLDGGLLIWEGVGVLLDGQPFIGWEGASGRKGMRRKGGVVKRKW